MDLTAQIEAAAQTADPNERRAKLRVLREEAESQLGTIDRHLADTEYQREAEVHAYAAREAMARQNATIREQMIARGFADADEMDQAGLLSHDDLDALSEEGLLEAALEALYPVTEGRVFGTMIHFQEKLHPRDRGGKFSKKFGSPSPPKRRKGGPNVPDDRKPNTDGAARAADEAAKAATHRPAPPSVPGRPATEPVLPGTTPDRGKGQSEANKAKVAKLAERINRRLAQQAGGRQSSPELTIFNPAGATSQHTLLQYVRDAASEPDTFQLHARTGADGRPVWSADRKQLHDKIIDMALRASYRDKDGELQFDPNGEYLAPDPDGQPKVLFSGGGYAAGKGASLKRLAAEDRLPQNALTLDPDRIKALLPEYQDGLDADDPEANLHVYREAWEIAQEVQRQAQQKKLNVVVDGISDTTVDEIQARLKSFHDHGYKSQIVYTDIPTEAAIQRAAGRAAGAKADSDRRHIPEVIMRAVHRDVAATIPALLEHMQTVDGPRPSIEVYDNDQGFDLHPTELDKNGDPKKMFRAPKRFAHFDPDTGKMTVEDTALYERLQQKAQETIPGVDAGLSEAAEVPQRGEKMDDKSASKPTSASASSDPSASTDPTENEAPSDYPESEDQVGRTTHQLITQGVRIDVPNELPPSGSGMNYADDSFGPGTPDRTPDEIAARGKATWSRVIADDWDSAAGPGAAPDEAEQGADQAVKPPADGQAAVGQQQTVQDAKTNADKGGQTPPPQKGQPK
jgi:hypothetical protein